MPYPPGRGDAVARARGTTARLAPDNPGPPVLSEEEERFILRYLSDHATMRPAEFEATYQQSWIAAHEQVKAFEQLLARHRRQNEKIWAAIDRAGTAGVDRHRQIEEERDAIMRGLDAVRSSPLGTATMLARSTQTSDVRELAEAAEAGQQAEAFLPNPTGTGKGIPRSMGRRRTASNRGVRNRGTSRAARAVAPRGAVVEPPAPRRARSREAPRPVEDGPLRSGRATAPAARARGARPAPQPLVRNIQARRAALKRPDLLARYLKRADQVKDETLDRLAMGQGNTELRHRLNKLRREFETIVAKVGIRRPLTPKERAAAMKILGEARPLAREDFDNLRETLTRELQRDPVLKQLATAMIKAGDAIQGTNGALQIRTIDDRTKVITHTWLNWDHQTRVVDNPWRYDDKRNLTLTDAPQNQKGLEDLRKHGKVWPTDRLEDFIIRHRLNARQRDFQPGSP